MTCMKEKAARGQTIRTETAPDRSSYKQDNKKALMGNKMGGGPRSTAHSLSGGGSTVDYTTKGKK